MPRWCIVPNCPFRFSRGHTKFQVPQDPARRQVWENAIPNVKNFLKRSHNVCVHHFEEKYLIRTWTSGSGEGIVKIPLQRPQLTDDAVPSIFNSYENNEVEVEIAGLEIGDYQPAHETDFMHMKNSSTTEVKEKNEKFLDPQSNEDPSIGLINDFLEKNETDLKRPKLSNLDPAYHSELPLKRLKLCDNAVSPIFNQNRIDRNEIEILELENGLLSHDNIHSVHEQEFPDPGASIDFNIVPRSNEINENNEKSSDPQANEDHSLISLNNFLGKNVSDLKRPASSTLDPAYHSELPLKRSKLSDDAVSPICNQNQIDHAEIEIADFKNEHSKGPEEDSRVNFNFLEEQFISKLPSPWSVTMTLVSCKKILVFHHTIVIKRETAPPLPVVNKSITLEEEQGRIQYFIYGKEVEDTDLPKFYIKNSSLEGILKTFQFKNVCCGLGNVDLNYLHNGTVDKDLSGRLRHKECFRLSKQKRCANCQKITTSSYRRIQRSSDKKPQQRINMRTLDPLMRKNLRLAKQRLNRVTRAKNRYKTQVEALKKKIFEKESKLASVSEDFLNDLCAKYKIPDAQKTAISEIIKAARTKTPNGRRYSEDWLMLCLLMNLRSSSYYDFLRRNEYLPLPSIKTVRNYFSLIDLKCGFDPNYQKILEKHFKRKKEIQKHGIIVYDEIHLRQSIKVCAKNLSYRGLIDFGENGPSPTSTEDQATHGLVLMFQPLCDKDPQPFAVFASKNSVKGEELAKIIIQGIIYLEKSGAYVHGINGDGASTNYNMDRLLGIKSELGNTRTYFEHPLDEARKIFVFSDVPHLIKNVRNRLFNKKVLRISHEKSPIEWRYFELLYKYDNMQVNHIRMCPRITRRHIYLDNAAKMRVRLATQLLSNSSAKGLECYSKHYPEMRGCEETINFCLMINNLFDALNIKDANCGLSKDSPYFKVLEESLNFLNNWEKEFKDEKISKDEFLTKETAHGLRISIQSTMDLTTYLTEKYNFKYLLSGRINQDNLERFFGTVRQASGSNDHPDAPTFLQVYKLLSVYGSMKPPKYGNCTVTDESESPKMLVSLSELKEIYQKKPGAFTESMKKIKEKLDMLLSTQEKEIDEIIENPDHSSYCSAPNNDDVFIPDHDYCLSPIFDIIVYYTTGYLIRQILKKFKGCEECKDGLIDKSNQYKSEQLLTSMKTRGGLIHANTNIFHLILHIEEVFKKFCTSPDAFHVIVDEVMLSYEFKFPCQDHGPSILSYVINYYIRMRLLQYTYQENMNANKKFTKKKKMSKFEKH